jgi:hypothetical protein
MNKRWLFEVSIEKDTRTRRFPSLKYRRKIKMVPVISSEKIVGSGFSLIIGDMVSAFPYTKTFWP